LKEWLIHFICCPYCQKSLALRKFETSGGEIQAGVLLCECGRWYPIIDGVPRILWGEHRGDYTEFVSRYKQRLPQKIVSECESLREITTTSQVRDTFKTIWDKFPAFGMDDPRKQEFFDKLTARKFGLDSADELYSFFRNKAAILEVGTGSGQKLRMMGEHTNGKVIGLDLTSAAEHTYKNTMEMQNVAVIQADLFAPPLKKGVFDFIISDGVLHHTPDPKRAFLSIVPLLGKGGEILIRVYKKMGIVREFFTDLIRSYTTRVSEEECWEVCKLITKFAESISKLQSEIILPKDDPFLGLKKGKYSLHQFIYYGVFKCFYNKVFTFDENNMINFDWYRPVDAYRLTEEEVRQWFAEAGLSNIRIIDLINGISAIGKKL